MLAPLLNAMIIALSRGASVANAQLLQGLMSRVRVKSNPTQPPNPDHACCFVIALAKMDILIE
jgi:hypothetical protein